MADDFFQMRIDEQTAQELDKLAATTGIGNRSAVVRWLIRKEHELRFPAPVKMSSTEPTVTAQAG